MSRNAIEEQQLHSAEPQGTEQPRIDLIQRSAAGLLDDVVEPQQPTKDQRRESMLEGRVSFAQPRFDAMLKSLGRLLRNEGPLDYPECGRTCRSELFTA